MNTIFPSFLFSNSIRQIKERKAVTRFNPINDENMFLSRFVLQNSLSKAKESYKKKIRVGKFILEHRAIKFDLGVTEAVLQVYMIGSKIWHNICDYSNCPLQ